MRSPRADGAKVEQPSTSDHDHVVAFIVTDSVDAPDPARIIARASELGLPLVLDSTADRGLGFRMEGGESVMVTQMGAPIPDLVDHPTSVWAPAIDELLAARSHIVVATIGLPSDPVIGRTLQAVLCAAVAAATPAVAVTLGHGLYSAAAFTALAESAARDARPPALLLVDITWASEPSGATSILTHGLGRVGRREELFLTCPRPSRTWLDLVVSLVEALVTDATYELPPTGHTIGRNADERIPIQRTPNPTGAGLPVVHLAVAG